MKALNAFALLMSFSVAYGLKCYVCASVKDWDDCEKTNVEETCHADLDRCGKAAFSGTVASVRFVGFSKGCSSAANCNKDLRKVLANQTGASMDKCDVYCCTDDLCNGAKVPLVSTFLLMACALVALTSVTFKVA